MERKTIQMSQKEYIKYGPLVYATDYFEEDVNVNYYWPGDPPTGYNERGIPVDANGLECLDLESPFHPNWIPKKEKLEHNEFIGFSIPKWQCYQQWLQDNHLGCTDEQAKKFLFKWILDRSTPPMRFRSVLHTNIIRKIKESDLSVDEFIKKVYENE